MTKATGCEIYSRWYVIRSGVCVLIRKIRLAVTGVVKP